jgi:hypothetical protein
MLRLNHLGVAKLLNSKAGSPFGRVNCLAIQFPEVVLDDKVG